MAIYELESRPVVVVTEVWKESLPVSVRDDLVYVNGQVVGGYISGEKLPHIVSTVNISLSSGVSVLFLDELLPVYKRNTEQREWVVSCKSKVGSENTQVQLSTGVDDNTMNSPYRSLSFPSVEPNGMRATLHCYSGRIGRSEVLELLPCGGYQDRLCEGHIDWDDPRQEIRSGVSKYCDVHSLVPGEVLVREYAFSQQSWWRQGEMVMTDGVMPVPLDKPRGEKAWNLWYQCKGLESIGPKAWGHFTRALQGLYRDEAFSQVRSYRVSSERLSIVKQRMRDISRGNLPRPVVKTGCFSGYGKEPETSINGNRTRHRWCFETPTGPVIVIDSPDVQACYVFTDEDVARRWFEFDPSLSFREARRAAVRPIIHQGDWINVLDELLANMGVKEAVEKLADQRSVALAM